MGTITPAMVAMADLKRAMEVEPDFVWCQHMKIVQYLHNDGIDLEYAHITASYVMGIIFGIDTKNMILDNTDFEQDCCFHIFHQDENDKFTSCILCGAIKEEDNGI